MGGGKESSRADGAQMSLQVSCGGYKSFYALGLLDLFVSSDLSNGVHHINLVTPLKFNIDPKALKIGNPKRKLIFQPSFFRGYVKFRGCTWENHGKSWTL